MKSMLKAVWDMFSATRSVKWIPFWNAVLDGFACFARSFVDGFFTFGYLKHQIFLPKVENGCDSAVNSFGMTVDFARRVLLYFLIY